MHFHITATFRINKIWTELLNISSAFVTCVSPTTPASLPSLRKWISDRNDWYTNWQRTGYYTFKTQYHRYPLVILHSIIVATTYRVRLFPSGLRPSKLPNHLFQEPRLYLGLNQH